MSVTLRVLLCVISVLTTMFMLYRIRHAKVQIEDTLFWLVFSLILIFFGAFPGVVDWATSLVGIYSPVNFIFLSIIFILIVKLFLITIKVSQLENKLTQMTQNIALNEKQAQDEMNKDCVDNPAVK